MRKILIILTVAAVLTLIFCSRSNASGSEYPQTFIVSEIDEEADLIYLETFSGMVYTWEGVEDWMIGDIGAAIMDDNGTETITDDLIQQLRYTGYIG